MILRHRKSQKVQLKNITYFTTERSLSENASLETYRMQNYLYKFIRIIVDNSNIT